MEEIIYRIGKTYADGTTPADWKWNWWGTDPIKAAAQYGMVLEIFTEVDEGKTPDWRAVSNLTPNTDESLVVTYEGTDYWCAASVRWVGDDEPEGWSTYMIEYKKWIEAGNGTDQMPDYRDASWYEDFLNWINNGKPVDWANPPGGVPCEPIEWEDNHPSVIISNEGDPLLTD